MEKLSKEQLLELFENGDKPTEDDFRALIEATYNGEILVPAPPEIEVQELDVPFTMRTGYYFADTGVYTSGGTNWRTVGAPFTNTGTNTYKLKHPNTSRTQPQVRVIGYKGTAIVYNQILRVGETFTIDHTIETFVFNGNTPNSNPSTANTPFTDVADMNQLTMVKFVNVEVESGETTTLASRLDYITSAIRELSPSVIQNPLKVLMVGNSFSEDILQHIHSICASAKADVIIGNMYRGGESLQGHYDGIASNATYVYHKRTAIGGTPSYTQTPSMTLGSGLMAENWDIIIFQQSSPLSGLYSSFNPYLGNLITLAKSQSTNPNVKIGLHMTWAYPSNSTESGFSNYNNNQTTMYNAIVDAYQKAMQAQNIDILIPTGTAIQNARTISYLNAINNELASDGYHLGDTGDYIGGLTFFNSIVANYSKKTLEDVTYSVGGNKYISYLCKIAVRNASINPFVVTDI